MIADRVRSMVGWHWLVLFGAILLSWSVLYAMSVPADLRETSRTFGADFWVAFCAVSLDAAGYGRVVLMWALMSTAMMLPTVLPAFATYDDLKGSAPPTSMLWLAAGFLTVWLGFSLLAAAMQLALFRVDLVSGFGDSRSARLSAVLLGMAGAYQFSDLKETCLSKCRSPMSFFLQHWDEGAWRMGLRLGATCLGCCWALMLLAFVGGVMSLGFMGIATLIMVLEKLPAIGRWLSRPLGVALIAGAGLATVSAF